MGMQKKGSTTSRNSSSGNGTLGKSRSTNARIRSRSSSTKGFHSWPRNQFFLCTESKRVLLAAKRQFFHFREVASCTATCQLLALTKSSGIGLPHDSKKGYLKISCIFALTGVFKIYFAPVSCGTI